MAPWPAGGGDLNFDLERLLRAPPSVLAFLLVRWLVDADLEVASAFGRHPLCSYQGPEGTSLSRIDGRWSSHGAAPRSGTAPALGHPGPHPGAIRLAPEGCILAGGEVHLPQAH